MRETGIETDGKRKRRRKGEGRGERDTDNNLIINRTVHFSHTHFWKTLFSKEVSTYIESMLWG